MPCFRGISLPGSDFLAVRAIVKLMTTSTNISTWRADLCGRRGIERGASGLEGDGVFEIGDDGASPSGMGGMSRDGRVLL